MSHNIQSKFLLQIAQLKNDEEMVICRELALK